MNIKEIEKKINRKLTNEELEKIKEIQDKVKDIPDVMNGLVKRCKSKQLPLDGNTSIGHYLNLAPGIFRQFPMQKIENLHIDGIELPIFIDSNVARMDLISADLFDRIDIVDNKTGNKVVNLVKKNLDERKKSLSIVGSLDYNTSNETENNINFSDAVKSIEYKNKNEDFGLNLILFTDINEFNASSNKLFSNDDNNLITTELSKMSFKKDSNGFMIKSDIDLNDTKINLNYTKISLEDDNQLSARLDQSSAFLSQSAKLLQDNQLFLDLFNINIKKEIAGLDFSVDFTSTSSEKNSDVGQFAGIHLNISFFPGFPSSIVPETGTNISNAVDLIGSVPSREVPLFLRQLQNNKNKDTASLNKLEVEIGKKDLEFVIPSLLSVDKVKGKVTLSKYESKQDTKDYLIQNDSNTAFNSYIGALFSGLPLVQLQDLTKQELNLSVEDMNPNTKPYKDFGAIPTQIMTSEALKKSLEIAPLVDQIVQERTIEEFLGEANIEGLLLSDKLRHNISLKYIVRDYKFDLNNSVNEYQNWAIVPEITLNYTIKESIDPSDGAYIAAKVRESNENNTELKFKYFQSVEDQRNTKRGVNALHGLNNDFAIGMERHNNIELGLNTPLTVGDIETKNKLNFYYKFINRDTEDLPSGPVGSDGEVIIETQSNESLLGVNLSSNIDLPMFLNGSLDLGVSYESKHKDIHYAYGSSTDLLRYNTVGELNVNKFKIDAKININPNDDWDGHLGLTYAGRAQDENYLDLEIEPILYIDFHTNYSLSDKFDLTLEANNNAASEYKKSKEGTIIQNSTSSPVIKLGGRYHL